MDNLSDSICVVFNLTHMSPESTDHRLFREVAILTTNAENQKS